MPTKWRQLWQQQLLPYLLLGLVIPLLLVVMVGLYSLWQLGWLWQLLAVSLLVSLLLRGLWWAWCWHLSRRPAQAASQEQQKLAESVANSDWLPKDSQHYQALLPEVLAMSQASRFADWQQDGLAIFQRVAEQYGRDLYGFTASQFLQLLAAVSLDYQQQLEQRLPMLAKMPLNWLATAYAHKHKLGRAQRLWQLYRRWRWLTPGGLLKELQARYVTDPLWQELEQGAYQQALQLLHLEFLKAAINLYGRYSQPVLVARAPMPTAPSLQPLRVCLLGQVNAGKSSLLNALGAEQAETSWQACTPRAQGYFLPLQGQDMEWLDQPGLAADWRPKQQRKLLQDIEDSDLVIWLLQANQPARQVDSQFNALVQALPHRPLILGLLNHMDQLPQGQGAEQVLAEALAYNQSVLGCDALLPVCLLPGQLTNLGAVKEWLLQHRQAAINQQLQRRRLQSERWRWRDGLRQLKALWPKGR